MAVKTYSLKKDGNKKLSKNFAVKEFRCKDGSDEILIDDKLVELLQKLRDKFGVISISSAYRTATHNSKVGGVPKSQHRYGTAADITLTSNKKLLECARYAEKIGFTGIGLDNQYQNFIHVDTRKTKSYFRYNSRGGTYSVTSFYPTLRVGSVGADVKTLQTALKKLGYKGANGKPLTIDGKFGNNVEFAVENFQRANSLTVDGIAGAKTLIKLW